MELNLGLVNKVVALASASRLGGVPLVLSLAAACARVAHKRGVPLPLLQVFVSAGYTASVAEPGAPAVRRAS